MARKISFFVVILIVLGVIVGVLFNNKKELAAKVEKPVVVDKVPVKVSPVVRKKLVEHLSVIGTVIPHNDIVVMSETQGRVVQVNKEKGDKVAKGELIVLVDQELKEANVKTIEANLEKARADLKRIEDLLKEKIGTETQAEGARLQVKNLEIQLSVAKRQLNDTRITAPIGGVINERMVNLGATVGPGSPIANIVDLSVLKLVVSVPEQDVFKLKVGDPVEIVVDAFADAKMKGTVMTIAAKGDQGHSFPVEVRVQNDPAISLRAGMFARANFLSIPNRESMTIPREALVGGAKDPQVYVLDGETARLKKIVLGGEQGNTLEVKDGLSENDQVVVNGQINLRDSAKVMVVQ